MKILILDENNLYSSYFISLLKDTIEIDIVTRCEIKNNKKNVRILIGNRREGNVGRELQKKYNVIIDTDCLVVEDIDRIFEFVIAEKYILFSTAQVYRYVWGKIFCEDDINYEYINRINGEYIDFEKEKLKFYIREKINIEQRLKNICTQKSITYNILRLSKCYSEKDIYKDIRWINYMLRHYNGVLVTCNNLKTIGEYSVVYVEDIIKIIEKILLDDNLQNEIFNIAQDEILSFFKVTSILSMIRNKNLSYEIIYVPDICENIIKVPCGEQLLISNNHLTNKYNIKFTKTEKWVEKIYKMQQKKNICIEEKEKLMILEFVKYKKNLQNILETEKNNLLKEKNEGKIIKLYENL